jgi:hypothetical protein
MKKAILVLWLAASALSTAQAGALFDDYLNYVSPESVLAPDRRKPQQPLSNPSDNRLPSPQGPEKFTG